MTNRLTRSTTYAVAVAFSQSAPSARKVVNRQRRCTMLAVAKRISRIDGERLDALRVPWNRIRWIGQARVPSERQARLAAVLAKYEIAA